MRDLTIISERLNSLNALANRQSILLEEIRPEFRKDLQNFIIGHTITLRDGKVVIGNNLYRQWLSKVRYRGFDFEIDFKQ
jgi:hypothetical protein